MKKLWILLISAKVIGVVCIQFSFIPSPNITTLQSAVYQCTLNEVDPSYIVALAWRVNDISSSSPSWPSFSTNYNIVVDGVGTHNSTLTIPGDSTALNETTVKCIAAGLVNGKGYLNTSSDTLYIQGAPTSVNLNCSHHSVCTIKCIWSVPYTLPGVDISGYNINISNETSNLIMVTVNETEYIYNVSEFDSYTISVVATIGDNLKGRINSALIEIHKVIGIWSVELYYQNSQLRASCIIEDPELTAHAGVKPSSFLFITTFQTYCMNLTKSHQHHKVIVGETYINSDNKKITASVLLKYATGLQVHSNDSQIISTFDVQSLIISSNNSETCFECVFLNGSNARGCFIEFKCNKTSSTDSDLTIYNDETSSICCINFIFMISCEYIILVYDIESDGTVNTSGPAAYSTHTYVPSSNSPSCPSSTSPLFTISTLVPVLNTTTILIVSIRRTTKDGMLIAAVAVIAIVFLSAIVVLTILPLLCFLKKNYKSVLHSKKGNASISSLTTKVSVPVADNPCYESIIKGDGTNYRLQYHVKDNLCYETVLQACKNADHENTY